MLRPALLLLLIATACKDPAPAPDAHAPAASASLDKPPTRETPVVVARVPPGRTLSELTPTAGGIFALERSKAADGSLTDRLVHFPKAGGTRSVVVDDLLPFAQIVGADSSSVVYATLCGLGLDRYCVMRARLGGSRPERLAVAKTEGNAYGLDAAAVYYQNDARAAFELVRLPLDGKPAQTIASQPRPDTGVYSVSDLTLDAEALYWLVARVLVRVPKAGGTPRVLSEAHAGHALTSDGKSVFWLEELALRRIDANGGHAAALWKSRLIAPTELAAGERYAYWVAGGWLNRVPKAGGAHEPLGISGVSGLTAHENQLYWFDEKTSSILKLRI